MKTLITYFKEKKLEKLDKESKAILYKNILKGIKQNKPFHKTLLQRIYHTKYFIISGMVIFFLTFGYIYNPGISIQNMRFGSIAQAEYIGTVVSRNGSYQIIDNEHGGNTNSITHIPKGGSLVVEGGSEVSVKTSNNALAKVIGPAKITFIQKDNHIIVDVSYSNSIHIEKKSHEPLFAVNTDVLVVKTESKTIIRKTADVNLSLSTNSGSKPLLTSLAGELIISDDLGKSESVFIKERDSIILDSELRLFAVSDKDNISSYSEKKKDLIVEKVNDIKNNIPSLNGIIVNSGDDFINTDLDVVLVSSTGNISQSGISSDTGMLAMSTIEEDIIEEQSLFLENNGDLLRDSNSINRADPVIIQDNENELQNLLYVKPLLDGRLLELLDKLYEGYYYIHEKDISKVKDLILSLCQELRIQCDENNLIASLNKINGKIVNTYIITPDIKLVQ